MPGNMHATGLGRHWRALSGLWGGGSSFRHGVHPAECKDDTAHLPIHQFPFAPVLVLPLSQHIGQPSAPCVREGERVVRGQVLAKPAGAMSVALHAPATGLVRSVGLAPSVQGRMVDAIYLEPEPGSPQDVAEGTPCDWLTARREEILDAIQQAGVVGLGGAGFPTHAKLRTPEGKDVDTLIVNGVECEPYLTTDHRVMLEQPHDVWAGVRYALRATGAKRCVVGVEANKPDAAEVLSRTRPEDLVQAEVQVMRVKYPQGAEKMLIFAVLGREVPSGGLPWEVGAVVINVATTAEIGRLLPHGRGIQERVITVTGPGVCRRGNYRIPIGTTARFVLQTVGVQPDVSRVFLGGPMMGPAVSSLDVPITKGISGLVAFTERETGPLRAPSEKLCEQPSEQPCIRCGACLQACPLFLNPAELGLLARSGHHERMAHERHLWDCFECGSCTYVCPSNIPLVQYFRAAKADLRKRGIR